MVTYGNTHCRNCNTIHPQGSHVDESLETKRRAKEIVFHMSQIFLNQGLGRALPPGGAPLVRRELERPTIIGVLVAGGRTHVANSGGSSPFFNEAIRRIQRHIPNLIHVQTVIQPVLTRGRTQIPPATIANCQVDNGPLQCAAPKLIDAANRTVGQNLRLHYSMSEVWFDASTFERSTVVTDRRNEAAIARVHTDHGRSRTSCQTCQNVLPMLLCLS
jgi:hypothetical protein